MYTQDKPKKVIHAVTLLCIVLIFDIVVNANTIIMAPQAFSPVSVVVLFSWIAIIYMINKGHNWARIAFLILFMMSIPSMIFVLSGSLTSGPLSALIFVTPTILSVVAAGLLFHNESSQWFKREVQSPPAQDDPDLLRLTCSTCDTRYAIGEDAIVVTMDIAKKLFGEVISFQSDDPSSIIRKDLVSSASDVPTDRRATVLAQARETVQSLQASWRAGQKRVWICFKCKSLNDYPYCNEYAQGSSSLIEDAQSQEIKLIISDDKTKTLNALLLQAAESGNIQAAMESITAGADVNTKLSTGATPLLLATFDGHTDVVKLLLENGADPNIRFPGKNVTPLMIAVQNHHLEITKLLLKNGADVHATANNGLDALMVAKLNNDKRILELLIQKTEKLSSTSVEHMNRSDGEPESDSEQDDLSSVPFLECTGNNAGVLTCSDRSCPCGDPGTAIPRGQGYLFIWKELVEFRKDFLSDTEMRSALANGRLTATQQRALEDALATAGSAYPILLCERGARKRGLNLEIAAADAARWWASGRVPLRPTPLASHY